MNLTNFKVCFAKPEAQSIVSSHMINAVEDFPRGYPQFTRLLVAHPTLPMCRKFLAMRARVLLMKQDRLSLLEEQLDELDNDEPSKLFLGNIRRDGNEARRGVLKAVDKALKDYGETWLYCKMQG